MSRSAAGRHTGARSAKSPTHPLKELEIVLNAGVYHLDSGEDGGTDNACDCLRDAAKIVNTYFEELGFDDSGHPPAELAEAELRIAARRHPSPEHGPVPPAPHGAGEAGSCR